MDARTMHINGNSYQFATRARPTATTSRTPCARGAGRRGGGPGGTTTSASRCGSSFARGPGWRTWSGTPLTVRWYTGLFDLAHAGKLWIWDAQWTFAMWIRPEFASFGRATS